MIEIHKSQTADMRTTSDFANVSKDTLLRSSRQHIEDVRRALDFFAGELVAAGQRHDTDKITDIDGFHADFVRGFAADAQEWWTRHRRLNRHHLEMADGIPADVNLIDVLDYIADCVMAGMARSGSVWPLELPPDLLYRAFKNTAALLESQVRVVGDGGPTGAEAAMTQPEIDEVIAALDWPIQARDEDFVEVHKSLIAVALACLRDYVPREDREDALREAESSMAEYERGHGGRSYMREARRLLKLEPQP